MRALTPVGAPPRSPRRERGRAVPGVDDAGFPHAGQEPLKISDDELHERLVGAFPARLRAARALGVVR